MGRGELLSGPHSNHRLEATVRHVFETIGCTPRGSCDNTQLLRRVLRRVLETAFEKVLRRVLRSCYAKVTTGREGEGSEQGT